MNLEALIKPFYNPYAPPLTEAELEKAKQDVVSYAHVIRSITEKDVDCYAVLSFLEADSGSFVKLRGISQTKEGCNKIATKVLKTLDSKTPLVYVRAGAWVPVTNRPKEIAKERYKVVDGVMVPDDKQTSEVDKCEKTLDDYYRNEDEEHSRQMERRRALLSAQTVDDDTSAYVVKKMMLHETRRQMAFIAEKLRLMTARESALIKLMSHDVEHEASWRCVYESKLKETGQMAPELNASFIPSENHTRQECIDELKKVTDEFNNLRL